MLTKENFLSKLNKLLKREQKQEEDQSDYESARELFEDSNHPSPPKQQQSQEQREMDEQIKNLKSILQKGGETKNSEKKKVTFAQVENQYVLFDENKRWNEKLKKQKKGRFDPEEKRILSKSLTQCLTQANISFEDFQNTVSDQTDEKIPRNLHLWTKICSVLPERSLVSCYKFLKRQISDKKGKWTEEETQRLKELINKYGRKWALIAKELGRTSENIRDRFRVIGQENSEEIVKGIWNLSTLIQFLKLLQRSTKVKFLKEGIDEELQREEKHDEIELKEARTKKRNTKSFMFHNNLVVVQYIHERFKNIKLEDVKWKEISTELKTKTVFDCRNKFVQLLQFQLRKQSTDVNQSLVECLVEAEYRSDKEIDWISLSKQIEDVSWEQLKNRWMIIKKQVEGRSTKNYGEIMKELAKKYHII